MTLSCTDIVDLETSKYETHIIQYLENTRDKDKIFRIQAYSEFFEYSNSIVADNKKILKALIGCYEKVFADANLHFKNPAEYFDLKFSFSYLKKQVTSSMKSIEISRLEKIMFVVDGEYVKNNQDAFFDSYMDAYFANKDYKKYRFWDTIDPREFDDPLAAIHDCGYLLGETLACFGNVDHYIHGRFLHLLIEKRINEVPMDIVTFMELYDNVFFKDCFRHLSNNLHWMPQDKHKSSFFDRCRHIGNNPDLEAYRVIFEMKEKKVVLDGSDKKILTDYLDKIGFRNNLTFQKKFDTLNEFAKMVFPNQNCYFLMNVVMNTMSCTDKEIAVYFVKDLFESKPGKKYIYSCDLGPYLEMVNFEYFIEFFKITIERKLSDIFNDSYDAFNDSIKIRDVLTELIDFIGPLRSIEIRNIKRYLDKYTCEKRDCYQTIMLSNVNSPFISTTFMVDNAMINIPHTGLRKYLNTLRDEYKKKPNMSFEFNYYVSKCVLEIDYPLGKIEASMNFIDAFILIIIDKHRNLNIDDLAEESGIDKKVVMTSIERMGKMIREKDTIIEMNPDYKNDTKTIRFGYKAKVKTHEITPSEYQSMKCHTLKKIKQSGTITKKELFESYMFKEMNNLTNIINEFIEKEYIKIDDEQICYLA